MKALTHGESFLFFINIAGVTGHAEGRATHSAFLVSRFSLKQNGVIILNQKEITVIVSC